LQRGKTRRAAADLLELQIGLRETDMLERFAGGDVREIAETLYRDPLAFELLGVGELGRHGQNLIEIVAQRRNHDEIGAAQRGRQHHAGGHEGERHFAGHQRHRRQTAGEKNQFVVDHADFSVEPLNGVSKGGEHPLCDILISAGVNTLAAKWLRLFAVEPILLERAAILRHPQWRRRHRAGGAETEVKLFQRRRFRRLYESAWKRKRRRKKHPSEADGRKPISIEYTSNQPTLLLFRITNHSDSPTNTSTSHDHEPHPCLRPKSLSPRSHLSISFSNCWMLMPFSGYQRLKPYSFAGLP
jgi:hypothetical protein